ncbi:MAG: PAS domain S-box protein, partial [Cytophagales bacterium]|nr:PAS domain S-box protein [Cytophagales bacterium]
MRQTKSIRVVQLAERQLMLSQNIAKTALVYEKGAQKEQLARLQAMRQELANNHLALTTESDTLKHVGLGSPAINALYDSLAPHYQVLVTAIDSLTSPSDLRIIFASVARIMQSEGPFLKYMSQIATQYEHQAQERMTRLLLTRRAAGLCMIFFILVVFVWLVVPFGRRLRRDQGQLLNLNQDLNESNQELMAREEEISQNLEQITALQERLELSERQFRQIVENAQDMIFELDEKGCFTYVNPALIKTSGYTQEELLTMGYWQLMPDEDVPHLRDFYTQQRLAAQADSYHEFKLLTKDKRIRWVGQNVTMVYEGKWVAKVKVIARDITTQKEWEAALLLSEQKFKLLTQ